MSLEAGATQRCTVKAPFNALVLREQVDLGLLEVLQLWHPPFLEALRGHFLGRTVLGTTFSWSDFPHYVAGAVLGLMLARAALGSRAWPSPPSS